MQTQRGHIKCTWFAVFFPGISSGSVGSIPGGESLAGLLVYDTTQQCFLLTLLSRSRNCFLQALVANPLRGRPQHGGWGRMKGRQECVCLANWTLLTPDWKSQGVPDKLISPLIAPCQRKERAIVSQTGSFVRTPWWFCRWKDSVFQNDRWINKVFPLVRGLLASLLVCWLG